MKKLVALLCVTALITLLGAGCSNKNTEATTKAVSGSEMTGADSGDIVSSKDTLIFGVAGEPITLNPFDHSGPESARVKRLVMEGLYERNSAGEYIPLLAESWEWMSDTELIINVRQNVKFSDGVTLSADDIIYTIEKRIELGDSIFSTYVNMDESGKTGDYQVKLVLTEPTSLLFPMLESQHFGIVHEETYEADNSGFMYNPVGTGPYILKEWKTGSNVILERNENYWGEPAYCKNVIYRYIPEASQRTIELETGGIDINLDVAYDDVEYFMSDDYKVSYFETPNVPALFYNMSDKRDSPVRNLELRKAMAYAIDTELISETYFHGVFGVANSNLSPYYASVYDAEGEDPLYAYDIDKSKALLAESGFAEGLELTLLLDENPINQGIGEIIQNMLSDIGIDMKIVTRNSTTWYSTVCTKEEYDVVMFTLYDPNPVFALMHFLDDGTFHMPDYTSWRNEAFEEALITVSRIPEIKNQVQLLREMDGYITEDLPVYSIVYSTNIVAMKSDVQNFEYRLSMPNANTIYFK